MKIIARFICLILALLTKVLVIAFIVAAVLWLLGLFGIAGNTVLALFTLSMLSVFLTAGLTEMIKIGAL